MSTVIPENKDDNLFKQHQLVALLMCEKFADCGVGS